MVRQWQTLFYGKRYSATILDDKVDFVKVAEGLGVKAVRVTKLPELLPAVEQAVKEKVPYMIEVQIDKDDKVFPMVAAGAPIDQAFDSEDLKNKKRGAGCCSCSDCGSLLCINVPEGRAL